MSVCTIPPEGWRCTRAAEHDGPCAAIPSYMSPGATLWREIDALGGAASGHSDFMRGWDAGHGEALTKVLAILERRGFTEHADRLSATDNRAPVEDGWDRRTIARCIEIVRETREGFLSEQYATPQPLGSIMERFACEQVAVAIYREFAMGSSEQRRLLGRPSHAEEYRAAAPTPPTGSRETGA